MSLVDSGDGSLPEVVLARKKDPPSSRMQVVSSPEVKSREKPMRIELRLEVSSSAEGSGRATVNRGSGFDSTIESSVASLIESSIPSRAGAWEGRNSATARRIRGLPCEDGWGLQKRARETFCGLSGRRRIDLGLSSGRRREASTEVEADLGSDGVLVLRPARMEDDLVMPGLATMRPSRTSGVRISSDGSLAGCLTVSSWAMSTSLTAHR